CDPWGLRPRLYAVACFAGSVPFVVAIPGACAPGFMLSPAAQARCLLSLRSLGLAPQALCCRLLRRLGAFCRCDPWGLRPRLYAVACCAGSAPSDMRLLSDRRLSKRYAVPVLPNTHKESRTSRCLNPSQTFSTTSFSQPKIAVPLLPSITNRDCTSISVAYCAALVGFLSA